MGLSPSAGIRNPASPPPHCRGLVSSQQALKPGLVSPCRQRALEVFRAQLQQHSQDRLRPLKDRLRPRVSALGLQKASDGQSTSSQRTNKTFRSSRTMMLAVMMTSTRRLSDCRQTEAPGRHHRGLGSDQHIHSVLGRQCPAQAWHRVDRRDFFSNFGMEAASWGRPFCNRTTANHLATQSPDLQRQSLRRSFRSEDHRAFELISGKTWPCRTARARRRALIVA